MTAFERTLEHFKSLGYRLCVRKSPHRLENDEFLLRSTKDEPYSDVLVFNHGRGFDNYGFELRFNADGSFHSHYVGFI